MSERCSELMNLVNGGSGDHILGKAHAIQNKVGNLTSLVLLAIKNYPKKDF